MSCALPRMPRNADTRAMRRPGEPPTLSAFDIGCVVVGGILGVGIFFTPRAVARAVDGPLEVVLAWALGGLIAGLGAMVFAELSGRVPGHGGMFAYIHRAFGRRPSFLYGWANWLVIQSGAMAVIALVLVDYAGQMVGAEQPPSDGARVTIAAAAILLFTALNAFGLRVGRGIQNGLTVVKVLAVFALVLLGVLTFHGGHAAPVAQADSGERVHPGLALRLAAAMLPVLFSFGGWQQGSFLAGAARRPRDVAVGVLVGVAVVVVAYLGVNLAFLALLGFEGARASEAIGADAVRVALTPFGLGDTGARALAALVVVSSLGILNTICFAPPFVLHAMSNEGLFPAAVGRLHPTRHVPVVAVLVQGLWAVVLLLATHAWADSWGGGGGAGDVLGFLLDGVVFVDWLFFGLCGLALFRLRRTGGENAADGYRMRYPRVVAGAFTLFALAVTTGAVATSPLPSLAGLAVCGAGGVIDWMRSRRAVGR
jgi:APA family basic amino acid/polyamine antiporter